MLANNLPTQTPRPVSRCLAREACAWRVSKYSNGRCFDGTYCPLAPPRYLTEVRRQKKKNHDF